MDAGLEESNNLAAPLQEVEQISCIAHQADNQVVGGALGHYWGQRCELQQLWVAPGSRGRGIGAQLLNQFEAHAAQMGCKSIYLETLSFQAPNFYRSRGYVVELEHTDYPHGISKFHMVKVLPNVSTAA